MSCTGYHMPHCIVLPNGKMANIVCADCGVAIPPVGPTRALAETASQAPIEDGAGVTEFNVNEYVWVQLTETGLVMHKADHAKYDGLLGEYQPPKTDADGWHRVQLWDLMHTYGSGCYNGARVPFKTTIRLAPPPPSTGEREPPVKEA